MSSNNSWGNGLHACHILTSNSIAGTKNSWLAPARNFRLAFRFWHEISETRISTHMHERVGIVGQGDTVPDGRTPLVSHPIKLIFALCHFELREARAKSPKHRLLSHHDCKGAEGIQTELLPLNPYFERQLILREHQDSSCIETCNLYTTTMTSIDRDLVPPYDGGRKNRATYPILATVSVLSKNL